MSLLLLLHSLEDEAEDTMSQSDGQMHAPSSPAHVGFDELTVQEEQTLSLALQYVVPADELEAVAVAIVHVPSMRLYAHPVVATH